jgi:gamma-glutamylcyclotransferase (GGCT)/AIG2-like uncharacterized protein YtfP
MSHDSADAHIRLAVYGTLGPGRPNHHQLSALAGRWLRGSVRGRLVAEGWGAALGYPGLVLGAGEHDDVIEVDVLESLDLPQHWDRLDAFEGSGYLRRATQVSTDAGPVWAYIYTLVPD